MRKLISSIFITIILVYFMMKTTSPKIIFIPFIICSISMAGQCIALMLKKEKMANIFRKIFVTGFLLFWFGMIGVGAYTCIRDKNYGMLIYLTLFLVVGFFMLRGKFLDKRSDGNAGGKSGVIISAILVFIAFTAGIFIMFFGIKRQDAGLIFVGAFFAFGAFTFVLGALAVMGYLDKFKIDILGLYIGVLFVVIGIGFGILMYRNMTQGNGPWMIIPALMTGAGVLQTVKCLKNKK